MQPDKASWLSYDTIGNYEWGKSKSVLTGTNNRSWENKSWVIGVQYDGIEKAYDWNELKQKHILHDELGSTPVVIVLGSDNQSFSVFKRRSDEYFTLQQDTLTSGLNRYTLMGKNVTDDTKDLERIQAYQEFWHSWRTFHPKTLQYKEN